MCFAQGKHSINICYYYYYLSYCVYGSVQRDTGPGCPQVISTQRGKPGRSRGGARGRLAHERLRLEASSLEWSDRAWVPGAKGSPLSEPHELPSSAGTWGR